MAANPHDVKNDVEKFSEDKLRQEHFENQRVIVRIWTSGSNIDKQGADVGHVSIENPGNFYLSLWPIDDGKTAKYAYAYAVKHKLQPNLADDIKEENNRQPEYTLCFYTLDVDKITKKYDEVSTTTKGWSVTGLAFCGNNDSCASSAWKLLLAGRLGKLISHSEQLSASAAGSIRGASMSNVGGSVYASEMFISSLIKSPDAVAKFLQKAKLKELEIAPQTKKLSFSGETPIEIFLQDKWQDKCLNNTLFCFNYLRKHPGYVALGVMGIAYATGCKPPATVTDAILKAVPDSCKIM